MKKLYFKLFFASLPILLIVLLYVCTDPFRVVFHYDKFHDKDGMLFISLNNEYTNTEMFLKNYSKYNYDSYIFGSSRSRNYKMEEWEKHISSNACFHFDASGESLYGVERKFNFLHNRGVKIKNAILVFDPELLAVTTNSNGHVFRKHPAISGEGYLSYQLVYFKDFLDYDFMKAYLYYLTTHKVSNESIRKFLFNPYEYHYEEAINEESYPQLEVTIEKDPDLFYLPRKDVFYMRDATEQFSKSTIQEEQKKLLLHIKSILAEYHTDYRVVISPLYNQKKLDTTDLHILKDIFGKEMVFDFSGKNEITDNVHNYYDGSHYRPKIAAMIMDSIYAHKN